jgi:nitrite reductase (NADH) small subunit
MVYEKNINYSEIFVIWGFDNMTEFVKVCGKNEIESGKGKVVDVKGKSIAVLNENGEFFAMDNTCAHAQGPLGEGSCEGGKVTCPWHGWQYDCKTGVCEGNPDVKLTVYEVKVEGEDVMVNSEAKLE